MRTSFYKRLLVFCQSVKRREDHLSCSKTISQKTSLQYYFRPSKCKASSDIQESSQSNFFVLLPHERPPNQENLGKLSFKEEKIFPPFLE